MPIGLKSDERQHKARSSGATRTPFERDRDRILYSDAFRRLKGVAQVARSQEAYTYHTRLTHSLKVSQVGRRLAQYLLRTNGGQDTNEITRDSKTIQIEPSIVATAALAHDLGHPPFGHAAEDELDRLISSGHRPVDDGFEGNPQSFRIVSKVETNTLFSEQPGDGGKGLNLTRGSLNSILKYPWARGENVPDTDYNTNRKFGYYNKEKDLFEWVREDSPNYVRSPEATLMDWADDVTYAVHDVIDFYKTGLIPLHDFFQDTEERNEFIEHFEDEKGDKVIDGFDPTAFLEGLKKEGLDEPEMKRSYQGTRQSDALLDRLQSKLIEDYLSVPDTVEVTLPGNAEDKRPATRVGVSRPVIDIDPVKQAEVEFLKELTFHYVINDRSLMSQQQGHRQIIATLFEAFLAAADGEYPLKNLASDVVNKNIIPQPFRDDLLAADTPSERVRYTADTLTVLTEQQAVRLYGRITGQQPGSIQETIIR